MPSYSVNEKVIKLMIVPTGGLRREGITSSQLEYMKRIDKTKFQVTVIAAHNNAPDVIKEFRQYGCNVVKLPDRKKHLLKYCMSLKKELEKGYDIIHVHGNSALMAVELVIAKKVGVKVRIAHSRNTMCDHQWIDKVLRPLFNRSYTYAMACGREAGKWLFPNRRFEVFHNGKDFSKFRFDIDERRIQRKSLGLDNKIVFGHVGNLSKQKNHTFLLDVFYEIIKIQPDAILYLMGDGGLLGELKQKIHNLHLENSVVLAGRVDDVHRRLAAMDVMIFPSLFEGLPNVVLEWQAEGLPCLISDTITNECIETDFVRLISLEDDPKKWASKAVSMKVSDEERNEYSQAAIKALSNSGFEINESVTKLERRYRWLVEKKTTS